MVINNLKKSKIKILVDKEDIKNAGIPLINWIRFPERNLKKLLNNIPELKNLNQKTINIYSYKFILFYIFIEK